MSYYFRQHWENCQITSVGVATHRLQIAALRYLMYETIASIIFCLIVVCPFDIHDNVVDGLVSNHDEYFDNIFSAVAAIASKAGNRRSVSQGLTLTRSKIRPIQASKNGVGLSRRKSQKNQLEIKSERLQITPIDGFPNGLPKQIPKGVRIVLENSKRDADGEIIMNDLPGEAGVDYPILSSVPNTGFDCSKQNFPGIYADTAADCQVFWMCQPNGHFDGFLCPNGTIFNQEYFICDWWYNVDCSLVTMFYPLNEFLYENNSDNEDPTFLDSPQMKNYNTFSSDA